MRAIHKILLDGILQRSVRPATFVVSAPGYANISGQEVDFGSLEIGGHADIVFTITNTGDSAVEVTAINITGTGYSLFSGAAPQTVNGHSTYQFTVRSVPPAPGTYAGSITVLATGFADVVATTTTYLASDTSPFNATFNNIVFDFDFWDDGSVFAAGSFTSVNGSTRTTAATLSASGTLLSADPVVNGGAYAGCIIDDGPSGWALIGGSFSTVSGASRSCLAAINRDGTHRTSWPNTLITGGEVYDIKKDSQGRILVSGTFTSVLGVGHKYLVRLLQDGTIDPTWTLQNRTNWLQNVRPHLLADDRIMCPVPQPPFTNFGAALPDDMIVRLDANGLYDNTFSTTGTSLNTKVVHEDSLGRLYRTQADQVFHPKLQRFDATGVLDTGFVPSIGGASTNEGLYDMLVDETNNRVIIAGTFDRVSGNTARKNLAAVSLVTGALDDTWNGGAAVASHPVYRIKMRPGDVFWVCGYFTSLNGVTEAYLAKGTLSTGAILN